MSISYWAYEANKRVSEAYNEGGAQAAKEAQHGNMGSVLGMTGGALSGAAIGSIVPVVGTGVGMILGAFLGGLRGLRDKSATDNLRTGVKVLSGLRGYPKTDP